MERRREDRERKKSEKERGRDGVKYIKLYYDIHVG